MTTAHEAREALFDRQRYADDTLADVCRALGLDADASRGDVLAAIERLRAERDEAREAQMPAGATLSLVEQLREARRERDEARAELEEGNAVATKHLRALRDLAWDIGGAHFECAPSWTSGEECLAHIRAGWDGVVRERDEEKARAESALDADRAVEL